MQKISMAYLKKYYPYFVLFISFVIVFGGVFLSPFSYTFNLGDNWGAMHSILQLKNAFLGIDIAPAVLTTPLYQLLGFFFSFFVNEFFLFNLFIFITFGLGRIGTYKLIVNLTQSRELATIGATFFAFSSLNIYALWINLLGWVWIPFLISAFLNNKTYRVFLFSVLLCLSGHYWFLIYGIILVTYFVFSLLYHKSIKLVFVSCSAFVFSCMFYLFPLLIGGNYIVGNVKDLNVIEHGFSFDLQYLIIPNNQNFITNSYGEYLSNDFFGSFRYSTYYGIVSVLLILYAGFQYFFKKVRGGLFFFSLFLCIFSLIFLPGNSLTINGIQLIDIMPFDIFQYLGLDGIFRKSVYVLYLINFALVLFICLTIKRKLSILLAIIISISLILENNFSFSRPLFSYQNVDIIPSDRHYLFVLPDTGTSINKYLYLLEANKQKIIKYKDVSNPLLKSGLKGTSDCVYQSIQNKRLEKNCKFRDDFFVKNNISRVLIFKRGYTENFFWEGSDGQLLLKQLFEDERKKYFHKTYENEDFILFAIKNLNFVYSDFSYAGESFISSRKNSINSPYYNIAIKNLSGVQSFIFLKDFHPQRKLYLSNPQLTCEEKEKLIYNSYEYLTGDAASYTGLINLTGLVQRGDSRSKLAQQNNLSISQLKALNPEISTLKPNQELVLGQKHALITPESRIQQTGTGNITECIRDDYIFFEGEELKYLREKPVFDDTHQLVNDYANGRTLDAEYIKKNFPKEYYKLNTDGSIDVNLTLYFKPQSYFYLGLGVSGLTFLGLITRLIIDRRKQKKSDPKQ